MNEQNKTEYATQCRDYASKELGDFTFDREQAENDGYFTATSPVFSNLQKLFQYCRTNGIELEHNPVKRLSFATLPHGNRDKCLYNPPASCSALWAQADWDRACLNLEHRINIGRASLNAKVGKVLSDKEFN